MDNQKNNINTDNTVEEEQPNDSIGPKEETEMLVNKIPPQYKALQDAAQNGTPFCKEIVEDTVDSK